MEKHIIIIVHAAPKTQPGGVQGAWFRFVYQLDIGPFSINQLPIASPPKLIIKNTIVILNCFIFITQIEVFQSSLEGYPLLNILNRYQFC
jgi:hypothetical protein